MTTLLWVGAVVSAVGTVLPVWMLTEYFVRQRRRTPDSAPVGMLPFLVPLPVCSLSGLAAGLAMTGRAGAAHTVGTVAVAWFGVLTAAQAAVALRYALPLLRPKRVVAAEYPERDDEPAAVAVPEAGR